MSKFVDLVTAWTLGQTAKVYHDDKLWTIKSLNDDLSIRIEFTEGGITQEMELSKIKAGRFFIEQSS